jgi:hypothetical protein
MSSGTAARDVFVVKPAADLVAERDLVVCTPQEPPPGAKQAFFRVPIRARPAAPAFLPGSRDAVGSTAGLKRVLLQFPQSFCHGIKEYDNLGTDSERANMTLGIALFDYRTGPTPEQTHMMRNLDEASAWLRTALYTTEKIRTTLGLGPANMPIEKQRMAAEMMDLHIAKPLLEKDAPKSSGTKRGDGAGGEPERARARYCYTKIVPPSPTVSEMPGAGRRRPRAGGRPRRHSSPTSGARTAPRCPWSACDSGATSRSCRTSSSRTSSSTRPSAACN